MCGLLKAYLRYMYDEWHSYPQNILLFYVIFKSVLVF